MRLTQFSNFELYNENQNEGGRTNEEIPLESISVVGHVQGCSVFGLLRFRHKYNSLKFHLTRRMNILGRDRSLAEHRDLISDFAITRKTVNSSSVRDAGVIFVERSLIAFTDRYQFRKLLALLPKEDKNYEKSSEK